MVVQRGLRQAASYHQDRLRQEKVGYFYDVITNGFGAMQGYAEQMPVRDRWLIVAYVRALQLSQHASVEDVPAGAPRRARRAGREQPAAAPRRRPAERQARDQRRLRLRKPITPSGTPLPGMQQFGMIAAVLGVVLAVRRLLRCRARDRFFQAYLVAYTFWMGVVLGSLALLMVQHLSGGAWGVVHPPAARSGGADACRSWRCCSCRSSFGMD